jgi:chemotaxis protein MotB
MPVSHSSFGGASGRGAPLPVIAPVIACGWLACATLTSGCAHSEAEWQAKVARVADLEAELGRERAQRGDASKARDEASTRLDKIERELREAGIDPAALKGNVEVQARAMEEHRRSAEQRAAAKARLAILRDRLAPLAKDGVVVGVRRGRVVITLPGDTLFDKGRESIRRPGKDLLAKVAEVIRGAPALTRRAWEVAGHLDSAKPGGAFKDGLGLSAMRAREVVAALRDPVSRGGGGLGAIRWTIAGLGDTDPVTSNDTAEGKARNRRCEHVLVPTPEETLDLADLGK